MKKKPTYKQRIEKLDASIAKLTERRKALAVKNAKKHLDRIQAFFDSIVGTTRFVDSSGHGVVDKSLRRIDSVSIKLSDDPAWVHVTVRMATVRERTDQDGDKQILRQKYGLYPYLPITWNPIKPGDHLTNVCNGKLVDDKEWLRVWAQVSNPVF